MTPQPKRVQRVRGVALPEGVRYVGRPSKWGNPYVFRERDLKAGRILVSDREAAVAQYEADLVADPVRLDAARRALAGHDLACYCPLDVNCHADVLLRLTNAEPGDATDPSREGQRYGPVEGRGQATSMPVVRAAAAAEVVLLGPLERAAGERFRDVGMASVAGDDPPTIEDYERARRDGRLWVATLDDEVVGYAWAEDLAGQAHLEQVSVLPEAGGQGVGIALVDRVQAWATEQGAASLTLSTFRDLRWNGPWYRRLGFTDLDPEEIATDARWQGLRAHEAERGLDIGARIVMRRPIPR